MHTSTKRLGIIAALLAGSLTNGPRVSAGQRLESPVYVTVAADSSGRADGAISATRNSPDAVAYLTCRLHWSVSSGVVGSCSAKDAAGKSAGCFTSEPAALETIKAITADAYVRFAWNAAGRCTDVTVEISSLDGPKLP